jgi:hypothetical protein
MSETLGEKHSTDNNSVPDYGPMTVRIFLRVRRKPSTEYSRRLHGRVSAPSIPSTAPDKDCVAASHLKSYHGSEARPKRR